MLTLIINKIQTLLFSFDSFCLVPKPPRVQSIASCRKVSHHCCFSCRRHRHRAYHSYCHRCNFVVVVGRDYVQSPSFSLLVSVQNFPHHRCQFQVPQLLISLVRVYHFLRACLPFLFCIMVSSCINLIGKPVIVKLKWGMEYKGMPMMLCNESIVLLLFPCYTFISVFNRQLVHDFFLSCIHCVILFFRLSRFR